VSPEEEVAVRLDERVKVLREARNLASRMDQDGANDPYLWGFGARKVVGALTRLLAEARGDARK
jgi:hypothetical protein